MILAAQKHGTESFDAVAMQTVNIQNNKGEEEKAKSYLSLSSMKVRLLITVCVRVHSLYFFKN